MLRRWLVLLSVLMLVVSPLADAFGAEIESPYNFDFFDGFPAFKEKHPEVTYRQNNVDYQTTADFNAALIAGTMESDLLSLATDAHDVQVILEKGYCADLSGYPAVAAAVQQMYPRIREQCMVNGKIFAVPKHFYMNYCGVVPETWEMLGFTREDIPDSFTALLDWIEKWLDRAESEDIRNVHLIRLDAYGYSATSYPTLLTQQALEQHIMQTQYAGASLRFDDPELREVLHRCKVLGDRLYQHELPPEENETMSHYGILDYYSISMRVGLDYMTAPRINADQPKLVKCSLSMMAVPSVSDHQALAGELVNDLMAGGGIVQADNRVFIFENEPIPLNPEYESAKAMIEERLAAIQKDLDNGKTKDASGQSLQDMKAMLELSLEKYFSPYLVRPETVDVYKTYVDGLFFPKPSVFNATENDRSAYEDLKEQYAAGLITVDELLSRLNQMAQMIEAENR